MGGVATVPLAIRIAPRATQQRRRAMSALPKSCEYAVRELTDFELDYVSGGEADVVVAVHVTTDIKVIAGLRFTTTYKTVKYKDGREVTTVKVDVTIDFELQPQ
jgi:hypothetical protein